MFAKTKQEKLARLAILHANAVSLINGGKRDEETIDVLLKALQLFKEGKLGSVEKDESLDVRKKQRREFYLQYVEPYLKDRDSATYPESIFKLSRRISASFFTRSLPLLPELLQKPESWLSSLPKGQSVLEEIKEKVAPYGLHFGMSRKKIEEAFGSPLEKYLDNL